MSARAPATAPVEPPATDDRVRSSLCARIAAATERAGQKIDLQGLLTYLGVQCLQILRRPTLVGGRGEDLHDALQLFVLPLRNLARVHVKALGQLRQCLFILERFQRHFRLEGR